MAWKFIRLAHWRVWVAVVAATLIPLTATVRPAAAQSPVTCTYTVLNAWPGGFTANVDVTNNGPVINGWTVQWTFLTPTSDIQAWLAAITEQGNRASASNLSFNGTILTGQKASFAWNGSAESTAVPTDLTINGTPC